MGNEKFFKFSKEGYVNDVATGEIFNARTHSLEENKEKNEAKIKELVEEIGRIKSRPTTREFSKTVSVSNLLTQVGLCSIATGSVLYTACKYLLMREVDKGALSVIGFAGASALITLINAICYNEKPLSNALNNLLVYEKEKKISKLNKENEDIEYMKKLLSCHTYEDMCKSEDEHMCVEDMDR